MRRQSAANAWDRMRRCCAKLCIASQLVVPPVLPFAVAAQQLGGIAETEEEQYWAFRDSAEALLARAMYAVALQEIEEALLLRPGDPEATALRASIVAAMNPPTAAAKEKKRSSMPESEPVALKPKAEPVLPLIDLTQAALALIRGNAGHGVADWEGWRALVLAYMENWTARR